MTPQDALLASSPPRSGHKPKKRETPRACPLLDRPFLMLAQEPCSARLWRVSSGPTARLTLKSTVCGLNGLLPTLRVGALHLNPRPRSALLLLRPLSVGRKAIASLSAKKYGTPYFSARKRTSKYSRSCSQSLAELL